jgi:DNA-binding NtrC family response regulator
MPSAESAKAPIMLVDDDPAILKLLESILRKKGYENVVTFANPLEARDYFDGNSLAAVILDLRMPKLSGRALLEHISRRSPRVPAIVVTAENQIETAIDCMRCGAIDYLVKPIVVSRLLAGITAALETHALAAQVVAAPAVDRSSARFNPILTGNKEMLAQLRYLEIVAKSGQPVLITGETGTGKELFAQAVHRLSGRTGQFVTVNVAGLDEMMVADTLFGHRKGAYSGADENRDGLVKKASDGTLFLDEIGDLKESSQIKLLRLIQENEYYPLGADSHLLSKARLVLATNRQLQQLLDTGRFRRDLYYRLFAHRIEIPPLRKRRDDIPLLLDHFLAETAVAMGRRRLVCGEEAVELLRQYDFPGNVRELQAIVLDAAARSGDDSISPAVISGIISQFSLPAGQSREAGGQIAGDAGQPVTFARFPTLRQAEEELVRRALQISAHNREKAAQLLGISARELAGRLSRNGS